MSRSRTTTLARLAVMTMCALACTSAAFAQDDGQGASQAGIQTLRVMTGFQHFFKRVLTDDTAVVLNPGPIGPDFFSAYVNLPGAGPGTGALGVVNGPASLINVRFTAESQCANGGADFGWCGVRILINGVEAQPAPADYAFDSTNNGGDGSGSWEGHALDRHLCVRNPSPTGAPFAVPVQVQWRVFAGADPTTIPEFRLDDWSLTIESAAAQTCQ
jgi:hypothetical protein